MSGPGNLIHLPLLTRIVQLVCAIIYTPLVAWVCFSSMALEQIRKEEPNAPGCVTLDVAEFGASHINTKEANFTALVRGQKYVVFVGILVIVTSVVGLVLHICQQRLKFKNRLLNIVVFGVLGLIIIFGFGAVGVETYYATTYPWTIGLDIDRYRAAAAFIWFSLIAQIVELVWLFLSMNRGWDV